MFQKTTLKSLNKINIMKLKLTILLFLTTVFISVSQTVIGVVVGEDKIPLAGATVYLKDSQRGASTDFDGNFSIKATMGSTLVISYLGMKSKQIKVTKNNLFITLMFDSQVVEEVVITGYKKIKNRVFTGSTSLLKMNDIKIEGIQDVSKALEGRVAGLNIQNVSNTFGAAPRINIRGGASISANVQPLWVIDGAVYEDIVSLTPDELVSGDAVTLISSAIAGINSNDIEDIQVLKDASATSMYGARALNGVIVITTKSGKRNSKNKLSYSYEQTFRQIPTYSNYNLLNSQETMAIYQEMHRKGYFNEASSLYGKRAGVYYQLYKAINTYDPVKKTFAVANTNKGKQQFLRKREYQNTNWFKNLFTINPTQNHTITYKGGGKNNALYSSLGYFYDGGMSIADKVSRFTVNLKNTYYLSDRLTTKFTVQGNFRNQDAPGTFPRLKNTHIGTFMRDFDINPFVYALNTSRTLRPENKNGGLEYYRNNWADFNIINEYKNNYIKINLLDFKTQGELNFKVNENLKINGLLSLRKAITTNSHYIKENSNVVLAFKANENNIVANQNNYLVKDPLSPLSSAKVGLTHGGILKKTENTLDSYLGRISTDYNTNFNHHDIKLFGFGEIRASKRQLNPFKGYGIQYNRGNQIFTNPVIFDKLTLERENYFSLNTLNTRGVTFSGNATYGYKGKYILNAVMNYEGSNISGKGTRSRWLPTWNVGGKWNVHQEKLFQNIKNISSLSVRANYGLTAKMNEKAINSTAVYNSMITDRINLSERENIINILHLENRDLTWEKMYELNIGVDASFLNKQINTTVDIYQRKSFDLIDIVRTSGIGGQYYKYANFADMETKGIELFLETTNIKTPNFYWKSSLVTSFYNQKITRLKSSSNAFDLVSGTGKGNVVGYPRGALFSFKFNKLQENGLPTFNFKGYPFQNEPYKNIAGANFLDNKHATKYLKYEGAVEPNFSAGLSNTFNYKGLKLSLFITSQAGNKVRLQPTFDAQFADLNVFSKDYYDRWLVSGDENKTNVPVIPSKELIKIIGQQNIERAYNTYNYSDVKVADGSFIRMKNIALSYTMPNAFVKKIGLSNLQIKAQGTNLFLIYSDKKLRGQDPEFYRSGGVSLPITKQYTISLNLRF